MTSRGIHLVTKFVLSTVVLVCFVAGSVFAQSPVRGSVHPQVYHATDLGQVSGSMPMPMLQVAIKPSAEQMTALDKLISDQRNPASPSYHKWLTADQFGAQFGVSQADEAKIRSWLTARGFTNIQLGTSRRSFSFSGTAAQAQTAFGTQIHSMAVNGERHYANVSDVSLPNDLAPLIQNVRGLNDFHPRSHAHLVKSLFQPQYTDPGTGHWIAPGDIAKIYDIQSLHAAGIDGTGMNVAIVGQDDINLSDIADYRSNFGLPATTVNVVTFGPDPGFADPTKDGGDIESDLDLEMVSAVVPGAQITYVVSMDVYNSLWYAIENDVAPVISMSWGNCESSSYGSIELDFEIATKQAAAQGITLLVASGDNGATDCEYQNLAQGGAWNGLTVDEPSNQPGFTAVGGTSFVTSGGTYFSATNGAHGGSALSYIPEKAWNDTFMSPISGNALLSTGGGASKLFSKPAWQEGPGVPDDGARDILDVAMFSESGQDADGEQIAYLVCARGSCDSGTYDGVGGTSAASPVFAGIVTLLNQYLVANNELSQPGLGNINPNLYLLAQHTSDVFHDITQGNNNSPCVLGRPDCTVDTGNGLGSIGYSAGPGYDQTTGLGSVDAYNFVHEWTSVSMISTTTVLSSNPANLLDDGNPVTLTATVTAGDSSVPTGIVSFYAYEGALPAGMNNTAEASLGTATLDSTGKATLSFPNGLPDNQAFRLFASYAGTSAYAQSFSNNVAAHVPTWAYVTASSSQITVGDSETFTVQVRAAQNQPGTLTIFNGATPLSTVPLTATGMWMTGTLTVSNLPVGPNSITAQYTGDWYFAPVTSPPIVVTVNSATPSSTTTILTASPNPASFGSTVALTATVTSGGGTPTGAAAFYNGASLLGTLSLVNGVANFPIANLPVGLNSITAQYGATTNFAASTSNAVPVTISPISTSTSLSISPNPATFGAPVTLSVTVTPASGSTAPTGNVTFFNGSAQITTTSLSNGSASIPVSTLPVGTDSITVQYAGVTNFAASASVATPVTVNPVSTTTSLSASPNPATFGSTVTLTAMVLPTSGSTPPVGDVNFYSGATPIGTASLTNGNATLQVSNLPVGPDAITAKYAPGTSNFAASDSAATTVTINPISTTTSLTATPNPATFGAIVTLTATVAPASGSTAPTGTVAFFNGAAQIGTANLTNGSASIQVSTLPIGTDLGANSITAMYEGTTNFGSSNSGVARVTILPASTTTSLTASPNQTNYGSAVTLTATVVSGAGTPTGTVTFLNGANTLGTANLTSGVATLPVSNLPLGSDSITAQYAGAANFAASTSGATTVTVSQVITTTSLTAAPNPATIGSTVTLIATVMPASGSTAPTGTVTFFNGAAQVGTANLTNGIANLHVSTLPLGTDTITAQYAGVTNFAASTSGATMVTVNPIGTTTSLTATPSQAAFGSPVTLTATVTPASGSTAPTGDVVFFNGGTPLGTANLTNGLASIQISTLPVGQYNLSAQYAGAGDFGGSASGSMPVTVTAINTTTSLTATPNQAAPGSPVTLTATVVPASGSTSPTGSVIFFNSTTQIGTANLTNGSASIQISTLPAGQNSITAKYAGTTNFAASTSGATTVTVTAINTTTSLTATPNQVVLASGSVVLKATVTPASGSTPTGVVTFLNGSAQIGQVTLANGSAVLEIANLPAGQNSIVAQYMGSTVDAASTSSPVTVTMLPITSTTGLTATPNQAIAGSQVTLTATIGPISSYTPTGVVTFYNGPTQIGTANLTTNSGSLLASASLQISTLPVGQDVITAQYAGDTEFTSSVSPAVTVTITGASNPGPSISSISPPFSSAGSAAFTLTVKGSGFISGSTVYWGNTALATQFVSDTQLTASVPANSIANAGTTAITVQTPAPGGGTSNTLTFEVDSAASSSGAPTFTNASVSVTAGTTATFQVTLPSSVSNASVTCLNLPQGATCSYSASTNAVTITTGANSPKGTYQVTVVFAESVAGTTAGFIVLPVLLLPLLAKKKLGKPGLWMVICIAILAGAGTLAVTGCGGGGDATGITNPPPPSTHQVTSSGVVNLTVQ